MVDMKLTILLIMINISIFLYSLQNLNGFVSNYGFSINKIEQKQYYVLITSMFFHGSEAHLAYNMLALFFLGIVVEKNIKYWKYLLVYLFSGILGDLSLYLPFFGYSKDTIAIGASAAISGLVGLGSFLFPTKVVIFPTPFPIPFMLAGAIYLLINFSNLFNPANIAYSAHIFGLLGGMLFGLIWSKDKKKKISVFILLLLLITGLPLFIGYFF